MTTMGEEDRASSIANGAQAYVDENGEMRAYVARIQSVRSEEYPALKDSIYLDRAGTTPIAKSLMDRFSADVIGNLYGNPHSASPSSQLTTRRIDDIRHDALGLFNADPAHFDLVFVANATAGMKLVGEALRDSSFGFEYGYHVDSHTSLVGLREWARPNSRCIATIEELDTWLGAEQSEYVDGRQGSVKLFAFPAQSNMNGRRVPIAPWCHRVRDAEKYSLLDAAALVSTAPLDLSDPDSAPDFTVLSFYKIMGFPNLGGLIVRKRSAGVLRARRYFGGGTVDMAVAVKEQWHMKKEDSIHAALEDGTLPLHNILALGHGLRVYEECFGSMKKVSCYTSMLSKLLHDGLKYLHHSNGVPLCKIYTPPHPQYGNARFQGPVIAFNMRTFEGLWISNTEVEKLASIHDIHLRSGGLCNPGGIASALGLAPWEMRENFSAGYRCGSGNTVINGKPTGMLRVSLGAMSTVEDIQKFLAFLKDYFIEMVTLSDSPPRVQSTRSADFWVEALTIYPIKSCGGWKIGQGQRWNVGPEGLAWDREWCLVHRGTQKALSQKQCPRMALIQPTLDLANGVLRIRDTGVATSFSITNEVVIPLSADPSCFDESANGQSSMVCGDGTPLRTYSSKAVSGFFTSALGVPCQLARLSGITFTRRIKVESLQHQPNELGGDAHHLSNESPILTISRSSLNRLNEQIKARGGKATQAEVFRANIVVAQHPDSKPGTEQPYIEDDWGMLRIGKEYYQMLGLCRRCQMVCIDQQTAEKDREPFATLAKTRRLGNGVWFGQHTRHLESQTNRHDSSIMVGDLVQPFNHEDAQAIMQDVVAVVQ